MASQIQKNPEIGHETRVQVKIGGDGARFSHTSSFISSVSLSREQPRMFFLDMVSDLPFHIRIIVVRACSLTL